MIRPKPWQVGQRSERAIIRDALALVGLDHLIDRAVASGEKPVSKAERNVVNHFSLLK